MKYLKLVWEVPCFILLLLFVLMSTALSGCTGPNLAANGEGITVGNGPHNLARQDDGAWETALQGVFPTNTVIDQDGAQVQTGGPNTVLGFGVGDVSLFTSNPADTAFESLVYIAPDGTSVEIAGFESTKSTVVEAWLPAILQSLVTQEFITEQQASVWNGLIESGQATLADLIGSLVTGGL